MRRRTGRRKRRGGGEGEQQERRGGGGEGGGRGGGGVGGRGRTNTLKFLLCLGFRRDTVGSIFPSFTSCPHFLNFL